MMAATREICDTMSISMRTSSGSASWVEQRATEAARWLLDFVFPPCCGHCGKVDQRFCGACLHELSRVPLQVAQKTNEHLDDLCATGPHEGVLQNALQAFKYEGATLLSEPLASRLTEALRGRAWVIDRIVPVPLHPERLWERGYNQSQLLSQQVARDLRLTCVADCLWRARHTQQQTRLSEEERRRNVRDAFEASEDVRGLSILLVDDVLTTGSTLGECAAALKAKGADAVYGIAVSHA